MHAARCQGQRALCSLYVVSWGEEPETQESLKLHHYPKILSEPVEIMKLFLLSKTFSFWQHDSRAYKCFSFSDRSFVSCLVSKGFEPGKLLELL